MRVKQTTGHLYITPKVFRDIYIAELYNEQSKETKGIYAFSQEAGNYIAIDNAFKLEEGDHYVLTVFTETLYNTIFTRFKADGAMVESLLCLVSQFSDVVSGEDLYYPNLTYKAIVNRVEADGGQFFFTPCLSLFEEMFPYEYTKIEDIIEEVYRTKVYCENSEFVDNSVNYTEYGTQTKYTFRD